jgi:hypothetical protein
MSFVQNKTNRDRLVLLAETQQDFWGQLREQALNEEISDQELQEAFDSMADIMPDIAAELRKQIAIPVVKLEPAPPAPIEFEKPEPDPVEYERMLGRAVRRG